MTTRLWPAGVVLAAAAALLLFPGSSQAQVRWGVGVGQPGTSIYFGNNYQGYNPGFYYGSGVGTAPWASNFGPRYNYSYYSGTIPWWSGGSDYTSYYSFPNSYRGYNYTYPSTNYQPGSTGGMTYTYPSSNYQVYYPPTTPTGSPAGGTTATREADNAAHVEVRVPANADIWFDGTKTTQTGTVRHFVSPPLDAGRAYSYEIRGRWMENGREVNQSRTITVRPGSQQTVDFVSGSRIDTIDPGDRDGAPRATEKVAPGDGGAAPGGDRPRPSIRDIPPANTNPPRTPNDR